MLARGPKLVPNEDQNNVQQNWPLPFNLLERIWGRSEAALLRFLGGRLVPTASNRLPIGTQKEGQVFNFRIPLEGMCARR